MAETEAERADGQHSDPNFPIGGLAIKPSFVKHAALCQEQFARQDHATGRTLKAHTHLAQSDAAHAAWAQDSEEDIEQYGIAGRVWEAAYLLQRYLSRPTESTSALQFDPPCALVVQEESTGVRAIELGAGVGLVGIHLACVLREQGRGAETKGDHVVLTDLDNVLPLLERNTERAGLMHGQNETADVSIKSLPWGSTRHADAIMNALSPAGLTHIICSDLVYFPELLPPLLRTLIHLTSDVHRPGPAAEVIISYKIRSLPKEEPFWRAFGAWFDFAPVLCSARNSTANAGQQGWRRFGSRRSDALGRGQETSLDGSDDGQEPAEDEVFIFVAHRRQETRACRAPHSDEKLMDGWLLCQDGTQVQGKGIDTFELILMASLET